MLAVCEGRTESFELGIYNSARIVGDSEVIAGRALRGRLGFALGNEDCCSVYRIALDGCQRFICLVERESFYPGLKVNLSCDVEEVTGICASHVGDAPNLPLSPEQAVVIELRNTIKMDSVNGNYA